MKASSRLTEGRSASDFDKELSIIEPVKLADLVIMDQHQLENFRHSNSVRYVVKNGRLCDGNTLDEMYPTPRKLDISVWTKEAPTVTTDVKE